MIIRTGPHDGFFLLRGGNVIKFRGPFENHPMNLEVDEISCPCLTPMQLEELAADFLEMAAQLRKMAQADAFAVPA